jgi:type II secretory ATPase GspE/PulE/Tfp pilus assembly ATPase PilB-like protein
MVPRVQSGLDERLATGPEGVPGAVEWLLNQAALARASDLHLEPQKNGILLRWRLDGCLHDVATVGTAVCGNVIQRVKILAGLLTYRTDIPQDGRISRSAQFDTEMRVSVYPAALGEKVVVRFFQEARADAASVAVQPAALDSLGLEAPIAAGLAEILKRPQGMLLLTGPAGSGKSTTLYAALAEIVRSSSGIRQIITIEDPVERLLPGVTHTELKEPSGLTYATALKAVLRQDPEVIMLGEIRDGETAQVAVQAALTGHLILSTIHAPSAPEVMLRVLHLGVEPYLAASVLNVVLEQRLLRRLCECKQPDAGVPGQPFRARGCERCAGTGFAGRLLLADLLRIEGGVKTAVLQRQGSTALTEAAMAQGWTGLWAKGLAKVASGLTTLSELRRVLVCVD